VLAGTVDDEFLGRHGHAILPGRTDVLMDAGGVTFDT